MESESNSDAARRTEQQMGILAWIVFGAIAGAIAAALMGERTGCVMNIIVGIIGAFVGGMLVSLLGGIPVTGFNLYSMIVAVLGAIVFLAILRALRGRRPPTRTV
jgi:uncharacterized membrane protein YeaQ/YmgE (transglycosylase-associated protein family)